MNSIHILYNLVVISILENQEGFLTYLLKIEDLRLLQYGGKEEGKHCFLVKTKTKMYR